jgi:predicted aldo/keto reductase-like oxidoreductase
LEGSGKTTKNDCAIGRIVTLLFKELSTNSSDNSHCDLLLKYAYKKGVAVVVTEPIRGGRLSRPRKEYTPFRVMLIIRIVLEYSCL